MPAEVLPSLSIWFTKPEALKAKLGGCQICFCFFGRKFDVFNFPQYFDFWTIGKCRGDNFVNPDFSSKNGNLKFPVDFPSERSYMDFTVHICK